MRVVLGNGEEARELRGVFASGNYFQALGVRPAVGRAFGEDEDRIPRGVPVAVISDGLWHSHFGGGDVLGKPLTLDGNRYTIIGVAPAGFSGIDLERVDVWLPLAAAAPEIFGKDWYSNQGMAWLVSFMRLRPGISTAQADDDLTSTARASTGSDTTRFDYGARFMTAPLSLAREPARTDRSTAGSVASWLAGVSLVVLLIACANVANLLLARALRRRREIAVRLALGVGRMRLVRQLLTESMLLALLGGALGVLAAHWGARVVRALLLPEVSWSDSLFDLRVLGIAAVATLLTGILTGIAPALQAGNRDLTGALKAGTREGTFRTSRLRTGLLLAQAALSVVLLVGAGLFVRSLRNIRTIDFGFDPEQVVVVGATYPDAMPGSAQQQSDEAMLERLRRLPYVERAALAITAPFQTMRISDVSIPGFDDSLRAMKGALPLINGVTPEYFATVGTRIVRGRGFSAADGRGAPRVTIVNETMAKRAWRGQDPLGRCVKVGGDTMPCSEVIGVARDIVDNNVRDASSMQYYVPFAQDQLTSTGRSLFARTRGAPSAVVETMRRELAHAAPSARYIDVRVMQTNIEPQVRPWRLGASMFSVFGALALLLAAVGLYSVIAYGVTQRTHELGVRVALGARTADVLRLVVSEGLRVAVVGVSAGAVIALLAGGWLAPLLFNVSPRDPSVFAAVTSVLLVVALAASLLPALRAARVDPATALRAD
jgi:predicted permease